jgi:hypothetical protein
VAGVSAVLTRSPTAATAAAAAAAAFERHLIAQPSDIAGALARLAEADAASLPLLSQEACASLLAASDALGYRPAKPVIGEGDRRVYQEFEICMPVPEASPFHACRDALERLLARALADLPAPPLARAPRLNDLVVQRYPAGSRGITAHRDHLCYRDLVAIVTLAGRARFFVSAERSGENAREVAIPPGSLLLMRAPGFAGREDRPFHFLTDVTETRVCLGLRRDVRTEAGGA